MIFLNKYPSIKLNSGIKIVNYSSPHTYKFHTGEELPACSDEVAQDTKLEAHHDKDKNDKGWYDITIFYTLSEMQKKELPMLAEFNEIDIILVPFPVLNCIRFDGNYLSNKKWSTAFNKIRVCKLDDRITKVIRSDEFCV